jgi:hypothetical protein
MKLICCAASGFGSPTRFFRWTLAIKRQKIYENIVISEPYFIKGLCYEIFHLKFFHQTTLSELLIHGLKPFRLWIRVRRDIRLWNRKFCRQRCQWLRGPYIYKADLFKGNINKKIIHRQIILHYIYNIRSKHLGWLNKFFWLAESLTPLTTKSAIHSRISQMARWRCLMKTTSGRKSRGTIPLND